MEKITFCIGTHNNLNYLKLAVKSVRENSFYKTAPFIIHAENCEDGTDEWLEENGEKYNLEYYIDKNQIPSGIGGGMNFCAEKTKTEFIMFLHADFYVGKNWDLELMKKFEKYPDERMWAFSYRIQPDIFNEPDRAGTTVLPLDEFGEYHHNFNSEYFLEWAEEFTKINDFEIKKTEWDYMGGNDDRFAPAYWEDADLFLRMMKEDFKFVLSSKSVVYHFASRSSRFPDDNLNTRPTHLAEIERISTQKFGKKWGGFPQRDENEHYKPMSIVDGSSYRINQK